jgi:internalin A
MSEPQANQPINFTSFADWCKHKDSLSESARHTVEVLLKKAGTSDYNEADKVLSRLSKLNLNSNQISEINPLSPLPNLTYLNLHSNEITDITPLSVLTNLTELNLYKNQITDITGLLALTNLTYLNLNHNQITDITGLSALTNLTSLNLGDNQITDITGLWALTNLTSLNLGDNQITDITGLSTLTNLTNLDLYKNQITDITLLSAFTNLNTLTLHDNEITDITSLSGLTNLYRLRLGYNQVTDITGLLGLTNLTHLDLYKNPITDLNLSSELTQKYLTLSTAPIDSQKATGSVKKIYAAIGRSAPQVIVCSSPQIASLKLLRLLKITSRSPDQTLLLTPGNLVLGKSLLEDLFQVEVKFSGGGLWDSLGNLIKIREQSADPILSSGFPVMQKNYVELWRANFRRSPLNYLEPLTSTHLVKEIHLTEFFISKGGVTLEQKTQELFHCQKQLLEHCGWIVPCEKICVVCDRPLHLRFDAENRLHAEGEPAIAFADGYSLYFHHGVQLPEKYGKVHPDLWQAQWLLSEENAKLRRLLIQTIGYDRICQQLQAVELDGWQEYTLLKIDNADVEPIYLLKMTCPSTGFIHALRVPPDVRSAQEAIRWVNWDIDPEEFSVQT